MRVRRRPGATVFPYTTLFRSVSRGRLEHGLRHGHRVVARYDAVDRVEGERHHRAATGLLEERKRRAGDREDRKSTRLNSSHPSISYAVFCLKKKNECMNA